MNSIYDIYESILDNIESTMNKGQYDVLIDMLFDKNDSTRQNAIEVLYKNIIEANSKQITLTNKIKMSDKYFIHFSDIRIGTHDDTLINNIILLKRNNDNYTIVSIIGIGRSSFYNPIIAYKEDLTNWNLIRSLVIPKDNELYEVPEKLNDLFEQIEKEANKHIK